VRLETEQDGAGGADAGATAATGPGPVPRSSPRSRDMPGIARRRAAATIVKPSTPGPGFGGAAPTPPAHRPSSLTVEFRIVWERARPLPDFFFKCIPQPRTPGSGVLRRHRLHIDPPLSQWNSESFGSGRARSLTFFKCIPQPRTPGSGLLRRHRLHIDPPLSQWNSESLGTGRARSLTFFNGIFQPRTRAAAVLHRHCIRADPLRPQRKAGVQRGEWRGLHRARPAPRRGI